MYHKCVFRGKNVSIVQIASLKSVQIVVSNEPRKTRPSVNTARTNIPRLYRFYQFFV